MNIRKQLMNLNRQDEGKTVSLSEVKGSISTNESHSLVNDCWKSQSCLMIKIQSHGITAGKKKKKISRLRTPTGF